MMPLRCRPVAVASLALALALAGCTSFQHHAGAPVEGRETRFEANGAPLRLAVRASDGRPVLQQCSARLVQGRVTTIIADTVILGTLTRVDPVVAFDRNCHTEGAARLVIADRSQVRIGAERYDARRTVGTVALLTLALAMVLASI